MNRTVETLMSLAIGVLAGAVVLAGLFGGASAPTLATHGSAMDAAPVMFLTHVDEPGALGSAPHAAFKTVDTPRKARANLRWMVQDGRCARPPAIDAFEFDPLRLAATRLELSTRLPQTF